MQRDLIAFVRMEKGSLPKEVFDVLLQEVCKLQKDQEAISFRVGSMACHLAVLDERRYSIGFCARGFLCIICTYEGDVIHHKGIFLADVKRADEKPPEKGALIMPLY